MTANDDKQKLQLTFVSILRHYLQFVISRSMATWLSCTGSIPVCYKYTILPIMQHREDINCFGRESGGDLPRTNNYDVYERIVHTGIYETYAYKSIIKCFLKNND